MQSLNSRSADLLIFRMLIYFGALADSPVAEVKTLISAEAVYTCLCRDVK